MPSNVTAPTMMDTLRFADLVATYLSLSHFDSEILVPSKFVSQLGIPYVRDMVSKPKIVLINTEHPII